MIANPLKQPGRAFSDAELDSVAAFAHRRAMTPLRDVPATAAQLGLARLLVKDESARWGLNAFKITGVSFALSRYLDEGAPRGGVGRVVCASAGNHGRAVAFAARERALPCRVFLPRDASRARVEAIRRDGAETVDTASYEEALARAGADAADPGALLISDTSRDTPPSEELDIPSLIVRGYARVFQEAAQQWLAPPDVLIVQGGVGGLVAAAAGWKAAALPSAQLIAAEPEGSACLKASALAGHRIALDGTTPTSMVCLRCAEPSASAWPFVSAGVDAFATVTDGESAAAVRALADAGIASGPSGACGLAALMQIAPHFAGRTALVIVTEGP